MNIDHVKWSRAQFNRIADGGTWAVPRDGLVFQKRGQTLVLIMQMPHDSNMPITAAQLKSQQDAGFNIIKHYFEAAGIPTSREC